MHFFPWKKPVLRYLELHLTDHCNLKCKGCTHFSSIADEYYLDPAGHRKDMERLSELFSNIAHIRLMGGEPLLHPRISDFFGPTRGAFPSSTIDIVTNGVLLPAMGQGFWEGCEENNIGIQVTRYPVKLDVGLIEKTASEKGVRIEISDEMTRFRAAINIKGDSAPEEAMRHCRGHFDCPFLREGRIYPCALPALAGYFNKRFSAGIPEDSYRDIHSAALSGYDILDFLDRPSKTCGYCATKYRSFEWGASEQSPAEWLA